MLKYSYVCIILFSLVLAFSCENCEDSTEPVAYIFFSSYQEDSTKVLGYSELINKAETNYGYPISMISDTTSYLFYKNGEIDTLSFSYQRDFKFESNSCGFTLELNSFELLEASTFKNVIFKVQESANSYIGEINKNEYYIEIRN